MLNALSITQMHDATTLAWHKTAEPAAVYPTQSPLLTVAITQHRANFDLWHQEDKARDPACTDAQITSVKHAIDTLNQRRNDLVEAIDHKLLDAAGTQSESAPLHSETPGLMIDRLSILALKIYHTDEEAHRDSATSEHRQKNMARLALLREQRDDLALCLDMLWNEIVAGTRRFKLYRQMKMYNDPDLNPVLYGRPTGPASPVG